MNNGNEYVTWKAFVALCLPIVIVPIVVSWILLTWHAGNQALMDQANNTFMTSTMAEIKVEIKELRQELLDCERRARVQERNPRSDFPRPE
jgi:hypothetical protein